MTDNIKWQTGVCSWSLNNDIRQIGQLREITGISRIHLHIRPELADDSDKFIGDIILQGWTISCGMISFEQEDYSNLESIAATGGIVPSFCWDKNRAKVEAAIDILSRIGVKYLSFHFGFIDKLDNSLKQKVVLLADYAFKKNVTLLMETGQETANQLSEFLNELNHPSLGVNFDPANMILYGKGNPCDSVELLAPWIKHIHIKDAKPSSKTGEWGSEAAWTKGEVGGDEFLKKLEMAGYRGALCVEREQGRKRFQDVVDAIKIVDNYIEQHINNANHL
jgi:sugar phosphate isomerase/epimerase